MPPPPLDWAPEASVGDSVASTSPHLGLLFMPTSESHAAGHFPNSFFTLHCLKMSLPSFRNSCMTSQMPFWGLKLQSESSSRNHCICFGRRDDSGLATGFQPPAALS